ncbi:hypothetical protein RND81_07G165300 [Saponaria officinalis]|uniref:F-box domain-containing protein n=1 Tax=Saponaria officinalis TaxID=3572 RepID=A0AAW1JT58_SAPOF
MNNSYCPSENYRNWLELPRDIILMILMKLQQVEIMDSVQFVCKPWYDLCKDPVMWRTIYFRDHERRCFRKPKSVLPNVPNMMIYHENMVLNAIDRSSGGLIDLDIECFVPEHLCSYVASRCTQLKRLRLLPSRNMFSKAMTEALQKLSSLEELEISMGSFRTEQLVSIIHSCPSLTTFKLNRDLRYRDRSCDKVALAIGRTMPELRHLQLIGDGLSNVGLKAILEGCSHLQSLHLLDCSHLNLDGYFRKQLAKQIKDLRCPDDFIEDSFRRIVDYDNMDSDDDGWDSDYDYDF